MHRCTGRFAMTPDSANATFLYDTRPGRAGWSPLLCRLFDVDPPTCRRSSAPRRLPDRSGGPRGRNGARPGNAGLWRGGDLSLVALGSGAVGVNQTHVYMGTSGWVSAVTDRRVVDTDSYIASILGAQEGSTTTSRSRRHRGSAWSVALASSARSRTDRGRATCPSKASSSESPANFSRPAATDFASSVWLLLVRLWRTIAASTFEKMSSSRCSVPVRASPSRNSGRDRGRGGGGEHSREHE